MSLFCLVHKVSWEPEGCPKCIGEFKALETERDRILQLLAKERLAFAWKECELEKDRDTWRSLCEKLYLKLQVFDIGTLKEGNKVQWTYSKDFYESLLDVLRSYEAAKRGMKLEGNPAKGFGGYIDCTLKEKEK